MKRKTKEAEDFLENILSMQEKLERENIKVVSAKSDLAVEPLNDPQFVSQPFKIILPDATMPGTFREIGRASCRERVY
jgi:hypothetical protein